MKSKKLFSYNNPLSFPRSPKIAAKSVRTSLAFFMAEKRESPPEADPPLAGKRWIPRSSRGMTVLLGFFIILMGAQAWAVGEETTGDYAAGMGTKIGRGLWNVLSSPAEIPCTMHDDIKTDGGMGAVSGFGKGIAFFARRLFVGVCEVGTFVVPMEATLPPVCSKPKPDVNPY